MSLSQTFKQLLADCFLLQPWKKANLNFFSYRLTRCIHEQACLSCYCRDSSFGGCLFCGGEGAGELFRFFPCRSGSDGKKDRACCCREKLQSRLCRHDEDRRRVGCRQGGEGSFRVEGRPAQGADRDQAATDRKAEGNPGSKASYLYPGTARRKDQGL